MTDKGIVGSGILQVLRVLKYAYDILMMYQNVHDGAAYARSNGNDCLIAIGGGSPDHCAKGIAVMATHEGVIQDYRGVEKIPGKRFPSSPFQQPLPYRIGGHFQLGHHGFKGADEVFLPQRQGRL